MKSSSRPDPKLVSATTELWKNSGVQHWIPVAGNSMLPILRPGDSVQVAHGQKSIFRGDIVVFRQNGGLVIHRVLAVRGKFLLTKGDNRLRPDPPVPSAAVLGKVAARRRNGQTADFTTLPVRRAGARRAALGLIAVFALSPVLWVRHRLLAGKRFRWLSTARRMVLQLLAHSGKQSGVEDE